MATKGSLEKEEIKNRILEMFPGSFVYDKEIRIPYNISGEEVQIKCSLTCAKTNVSQGDENALPQAASTNTVQSVPAAQPQKIEISDEEKQNVQNLLKSIGL